MSGAVQLRAAAVSGLGGRGAVRAAGRRAARLRRSHTGPIWPLPAAPLGAPGNISDSRSTRDGKASEAVPLGSTTLCGSSFSLTHWGGPGFGGGGLWPTHSENAYTVCPRLSSKDTRGLVILSGERGVQCIAGRLTAFLSFPRRWQ